MTDYNYLLEKVYNQYKSNNNGNLANYIPELGKVNPDLFGICVTTINGETYSVGDCQIPFTLQSTSKPFTYGLALNEYGLDLVHSKVGVEPSGEAFNSIIELEKKTHRPFNPMINSGAIAIACMIKGNQEHAPYAQLINHFNQLANQSLLLDENIYQSEKNTANRNKAILYLLKHFDVVDDQFNEGLDLYFKQCSINVTLENLSLMSSVLANNGINPKSKKVIYSPLFTQKILSLMFSCGMYDTAGTWSFKVGVPAKSGVSGAIFAVVPGKFSIACYSPLIDDHGHSIRGVLAITDFLNELNINIFNQG